MTRLVRGLYPEVSLTNKTDHKKFKALLDWHRVQVMHKGLSIPKLLAIVFTVLIIAIMLLGTLWIMFDLHACMM